MTTRDDDAHQLTTAGMTDPTGEIEVSVIIPALNAASTLGLQLSALTQQDFDLPWEVIIADNGSTDDTRGVATSFESPGVPIHVVDASDQPGQAHARNVALASAKGRVIAACDADDRVAPGWLHALHEASKEHPIVTGVIVRGIGPDLEPGDQSPPDRPTIGLDFKPIAYGGCMAIRRDVANEVGGWDTTLDFGGSEDVDLSWRVQLAGHPLGFEPRAIVFVRERDSLGARVRQMYRWGRGDVIMYRRYRRRGIQRRSARELLGETKWMMLSLPKLPSDPERRRRLASRIARNAGRIVESARSRTWYP